MKAHTYKTVTAALADVVAIQAMQGDERGQSFGDPIAEFPASYAERGWDPVQGIIIGFELSKDEQKQAIAQRKADLKQWRSVEDSKITLFEKGEDKTQISYAELADFAESHWTDDKGKFVTPTYGANCCFRRLYAIMASAYAFVMWEPGRQVFELPLQVRHYDSDPVIRAKEMRTDRLEENAQTGRQGYTMPEQLVIAVKDVKSAYREADIRRRLNVKRGVAQKLYSTAQLCRQFEELDLLARFNKPAPTDPETGSKVTPTYEPGGYIPLSSVTNQFSRTLLGLVEDAAKLDPTAGAILNGEPKRQATPAECEQAIEALIDNRQVPDKMMSKADLEAVKLGIPAACEPLHELLGGILTNNGEQVGQAVDAIKESIVTAQV